MNKQEFMNILQDRLATVNPSWRDEVLSDIEEHFINAAEAGASEDEVIRHLGDPMELAQQFYEEAALAGQIIPAAADGPSSSITASMNRRANGSSRRPESSLRKTIMNVDTPEETAEQQETPNVSTYTTQESFEDPFEGTASSSDDFFANWGRDFSKGFTKAFDSKAFSKSMRSIFNGLASSLESLNFNFGSTSSHETETLTFPPEDVIKNIRINVASPDITITESEDDFTYVEYDINIPGLTVQCTDGTLIIEQHNTVHSTRNQGISLEIRVPDLQPNLDVTSTLGDIEVTEITPDRMRLRSTTGDITVNVQSCQGNMYITTIEDIDVTVDEIHGEAIFQSTSGDLELYVQRAHDLQAKTVSGDICLESHKLENLSTSSISGDIELNVHSCLGNIIAASTSGDITSEIGTCAANMTLKSTSGDIESNIVSMGGSLQSTTLSGDIFLCPQDIQGNIEIRSNSGSVELTVPSLDRFSVELRSRSGDIDGDLPTSRRSNHQYCYGIGPQQLSIVTISGDITIN